jgi:hypothetical protein
MTKTRILLTTVAFGLAVLAGCGSTSAEPAPPQGAPNGPARCTVGAKLNDSAERAMTPEQHKEFTTFLRNGVCGRKVTAPGWLTAAGWKFGDTPPADGKFTMNGVTFDWKKITRPAS